MKRAVIYARYSSDRQTEQSIDGQVRVATKYANDNEYNIVGMYIDRAISGTTDNRPEFQKMIADSERKIFDYVIVYKLDRFARNRYDSAIHKKTLRNNGVKVISATEGISENPEGIILESMLEGYAEYYSAELSQKTKRGQNESIIKGKFLGGVVPYGYSSSNKKLIINENESYVVKKIFSLYASGKMTTEISKTLEKENIKNRQGKPFPYNTICNILKNKIYIGTYTWGDKTIQNYCPKIIDDETFEIVERRMNMNKRAPARMKAYEKYRLTGKLFCGHCESAMIGESGTSKSGNLYHYYKCTGRKKKNGCTKKTIGKDELENLVVKLVLEHVFHKDKILNIIDIVYDKHQESLGKNIELKILKDEIAQNDKYISNIMKAIKMGVVTETTQQELLRLENRNKELRLSVEVCEAKENKSYTREDVAFFFESLVKNDASDEDVKDSIIEFLVNKVFLYDDKMIIVLNNKNEKNIEANLKEIEKICSDMEQNGAPFRLKLSLSCYFKRFRDF